MYPRWAEILSYRTRDALQYKRGLELVVIKHLEEGNGLEVANGLEDVDLDYSKTMRGRYHQSELQHEQFTSDLCCGSVFAMQNFAKVAPEIQRSRVLGSQCFLLPG